MYSLHGHISRVPLSEEVASDESVPSRGERLRRNKMVRLRIPWLMLCLFTAQFVAGCAATTRTTVVQPLSAQREPGRHILVAVTSEGPATEAETNALGEQIVDRLKKTGRFAQVNLKRSPTQQADLLVHCSIADLRRVNLGARLIPVLNARRASMEVHVEVVAGDAMRIVGQATITGLSNGGGLLLWLPHAISGDLDAGTTSQAIEEAAEAVADFVVSA